MPVVFEPVTHRSAGGDGDLRISLTTSYHNAKSESAKYLALDFRVSPEIVKTWGVRSGDKVVGRLDDDGTWYLTVVMPTDKGYMIRVGGVRGHEGRRGYAYFRFAATGNVARVVFPHGQPTSREFQLAGIEGRTAMFLPVTVKSGLEFVPSH